MFVVVIVVTFCLIFMKLSVVVCEWTSHHCHHHIYFHYHHTCTHACTHACTRACTQHITVLQLFGFCLGQPRWAGIRRNYHPLSLIMVINHPYLLPPSTTICGILPIQSTCFTVFFHNPWVFFGLPLGLAPSTSYSIHLFTQSLSSFCNTCPYHRKLH